MASKNVRKLKKKNKTNKNKDDIGLEIDENDDNDE